MLTIKIMSDDDMARISAGEPAESPQVVSQTAAIRKQSGETGKMDE